MPWNPGEVDKFKKGLSPRSKRKWTNVANALLTKPGYTEKSAIRIANSQVKPNAVARRLKKNISGERYR